MNFLRVPDHREALLLLSKNRVAEPHLTSPRLTTPHPTLPHLRSMGDGGHQPGATGLAMSPVSQSHTQCLKHPRVTVIRIEAFVVAAAVLLFLQLVLGSRRRRSGGIVTQGGLWIAYTLSFPLITNTIGQMVSAPAKNALYLVWVVSLYHILGSTNSAVAYDLDDTKKWARRLFEQFQYFLYSFFIWFTLYTNIDLGPNVSVSDYFSGYPRLILVSVLLGTVLWSNMTSTLSIWMTNVSNPSKVVADYMKDLFKCKQLRYNSLEEYRDCYPVDYRDNFHPVISTDSSYYISKVREEDGIIMMSDIQKYCSGIVLLDSHGGTTTLTDICFSFSLFQLLKRRYFGLLCAEADTPEALDLVLTGFLPDDRGGPDYPQENTDQISERTFRIVEVQLGFLYDFFFTRYAFSLDTGSFSCILVITRIIFIVLGGVFVCQNSIGITTSTTIIEVKTQKADTITTLVVFGILFALEIVQLALQKASDWNRVAFACYHAANKTNANVSKCYNSYGFLKRLMCFPGYWKNEIGQYSILESGSGYSSAMLYLYKQKLFQYHSSLERVRSLFRFFYWAFLCIKSFFLNEKSSKVLSLTVKKAILSTLQSCNGKLTNGESSLMTVDQSGSLVAQFKWALSYESQAETMLIWHIATSYCEIAEISVKNIQITESPEVENIQTTQSPEVRNMQIPEAFEDESTAQDREVAKMLSRYCAYLMAFVPELLPDPEADTKFIFATAVSESKSYLEDSTDLEEQQEEEPITKRGIRLGKLLKSKGTVLQWKLLANFWAEKLLYIAPSDNVRGHIEHLAKGGEFLTHVWALLSNAGILNIDRKYDKNRVNAQPATQNA